MSLAQEASMFGPLPLIPPSIAEALLFASAFAILLFALQSTISRIVKERLALLRHRGQLEILDCPEGHPFECGVMARMTLPLWALEPTWHANEERKAS